MKQSDLSTLLPHFLTAARSNLTTLYSSFNNKSPSDDPTVVKERKIAAHSLKGECLAMGFKQTGTVAELLERIFRQQESKRSSLRQETVMTIQRALFRIKKSLDSIEAFQKEDTLDDVKNSLKNDLQKIL